mmetsp:Transcript_96143/g.271845  ORF Transcript_96143/g.271845 Transcript_96143/m.271845 type:complete len:271 (-) Transcript_96143:62-874(-)
MYCAEAAPRLAEAALATFKASPFGELYNGSFVRPGVSCAAHGHNISGGEDQCFPGLQIFYLTELAKIETGISIPAVQQKYARRYGLDIEVVRLMTVCTCHPDSQVSRAVSSACSALEPVTASWVTSGEGRALSCTEGPYVAAARSLATLKASKEFAMHLHDQVEATNCSALGFSFQTPETDPCYPAMRVWTRTPDSPDADLKRAQDIKTSLFSGGAERIMQEYNLDPLLANGPSCNCLPQSQEGQAAGASCAQLGAAGRSPVRDFWPGRP